MLKFDVEPYKELFGESYNGIFSTRDVKNSKSFEDAKVINSTEFSSLDSFFQFVYDQHSYKDLSDYNNDHNFRMHVWYNAFNVYDPHYYQMFVYDKISVEEIDELFLGDFCIRRTFCSRPNNEWLCNFKNIVGPMNLQGDQRPAFGKTIDECRNNFIKKLTPEPLKYSVARTTMNKTFLANDRVWYTSIQFREIYFST